MIKYEIGSWINKKWIIVSVLYSRKQNRKLLCYNPKYNIFKEGWIWDFTRDLINITPNKKPKCYSLCQTKINLEWDNILDVNYEYTNDIYFNTNYLTREEYSILRGYREGSFWDIEHILKKFDFLLSDDYNKCGQVRRNQKLAYLIASTYIILIQKGVI